jgi:hypothetical protein
LLPLIIPLDRIYTSQSGSDRSSLTKSPFFSVDKKKPEREGTGMTLSWSPMHERISCAVRIRNRNDTISPTWADHLMGALHGNTMQHTQITAARDRFMQAVQQELARFERSELEFRQRERKDRAAELNIPWQPTSTA